MENQDQLTEGGNSVATNTIRYFFEVIYNLKTLCDVPIPHLNQSPIIIRSATIEAVKNSKDNLLNPYIANLLKLGGVFIGVCFEYERKRFPILGYEGFIKQKDLLRNLEYELCLYQQNGWTEGVETEHIYSIHKKTHVETIKHKSLLN
jgi:hypothetical protein